MSCCSCVEKEDDSDLYFFHYRYNVDGFEYDVYQGRPGRGWGNGYYNSALKFKNIIFSYLDYTDDETYPFPSGTDNNIIMFEFFYQDGNGWRWFVNAPYIKDGEKNYMSKTQNYLNDRSYQFCCPQILNFTEDVYSPVYECQLVYGWMSFTRHTDDPDVILRVDFDAVFESKYPRYGERWAEDTTYTYHISDGRLDFSSKMAGRIIGGDKLR